MRGADPRPRFPIVRRTLSNGLRAVAQPDRRISLAAIFLCLPVGSRDDPREGSGLAHLVEHLVHRGTDGATLADLAGRLGGAAGAYTLHDRTCFSLLMPSWRLAEGLRLAADLLRPRPFSPAALATERRVLEQERLQRAARRPDGRALETAQRTLYPPGHPYHEPPSGGPEGSWQPTPADAEAFHRRRYTASRAVLALVGDLDPDRLWDEVGRCFAALPAAEEGEAAVPPPPEAADGRGSPEVRPRVEIHEPGRPTRVYYAFRAPGDGREGWTATALLARWLTLGRRGLLRRELVDGARLATGIGSFIVPMRDATTIVLAATAAPDTDAAALEATILSRLETAGRDGPPGDDLGRTAKKALTDFYTKMQRFDLRADRIAALTTYFDEPGRMEGEGDRYLAVEPEEVVAAAAACLRASHSTVVRLAPSG